MRLAWRVFQLSRLLSPRRNCLHRLSLQVQLNLVAKVNFSGAIILLVLVTWQAVVPDVDTTADADPALEEDVAS